MFTAEFLATLEKEGVAPIVTWNEKEPNLAATWNSYIHRTGDNKLLIPVQGMLTVQDNVARNNKVKMVIGSKEVQGKFGPGAGFLLEGTAAFIREGKQLAMMQERFPWANCVLEVSVSRITQTV
ncbi:MAG: pyridoxamine 5'-phosphate oxidase family protein [Rhodospirillaceae bacterium]|nr:pyridoxamine 5'-phosphate oxidase family protein [Rhodospirillaceae bacterium]MEA4837487.1 pyridoxamine 5'-phosphate oxidase family protein [Rhodospirillaceae bacterium]